MSFTIISQTPLDFSDSFANSISQSISANSNDAIVLSVRWRKTSGITFSNPAWNGQTLTQLGSTLDDGEALSAIFWIQAAATATANLTGDFSNYVIPVAEIVVARPGAAGTITAGGLQTQIYTGTGSADPSLSLTSVPVGAAVLSFLGAQGWDGAFGGVSTTFTPGLPLALASSGTNTGHNGVWSMYNANALASSGTVVASWARSDSGEPMYTHAAFYLSSAAVGPTIDTITSPITHGQTGLAITTTGLGTLTSMTVDSVAVASVSATGGDGTWVAKTRVDGATLPGYGSKAVVVGDGTLTATGSVTVNPPATQSFVTLTSVNTATGYLGASRTLNVGDQIAFDLAATLGVTANYIDIDGGIYTDYTGSQTIWHWVATTRVTAQITLINGIPQVTGSEGITIRGITSRGLSRRNISKRGLG